MDSTCPTAPIASTARKALRASGSTATSLIIWTCCSGGSGAKAKDFALAVSRRATASTSAPGRRVTVARTQLPGLAETRRVGGGVRNPGREGEGGEHAQDAGDRADQGRRGEHTALLAWPVHFHR